MRNEFGNDEIKKAWKKLNEIEMSKLPIEDTLQERYKSHRHKVAYNNFKNKFSKKYIWIFGRAVSKIAIVILVFLVFTGTVYAFRIPIFELMKKVLLKNTDILVESGNMIAPMTIENEFEVFDIPDGYQKLSVDSSVIAVEIVYNNGIYEILFRQSISNAVTNIDNEETTEEEVFLDNIESMGIYTEKYESGLLIWTYQGYLFELSCNDPQLELEDYIKMVNSIEEIR